MWGGGGGWGGEGATQGIVVALSTHITHVRNKMILFAIKKHELT